ncbi:MAG: hypothetical protein KZQ99_04645 [Candidatus Thiodiazotropha sp. (ex Dulcina madagascariensis)]|nr:hypothetical protein [Candidatus Thiodiazotropha sp. (ex Dulcina madagascariensis)]
MNDVHYWVFHEAQLDTALRKWANDPRHADITDDACKARFELVSSFLYSEILADAGMHKGFELQKNGPDGDPR